MSRRGEAPTPEVFLLDEGFDANSLNMATLRSILLKYDIPFTYSMRKNDLVSVFDTHITPNGKALYAKYHSASPSSSAIQDANLLSPRSAQQIDTPDTDSDVSPKISSILSPSKTPKAKRGSRQSVPVIAPANNLTAELAEAEAELQAEEDLAAAAAANSSILRRSSRKPVPRRDLSENALKTPKKPSDDIDDKLTSEADLDPETPRPNDMDVEQDLIANNDPLSPPPTEFIDEKTIIPDVNDINTSINNLDVDNGEENLLSTTPTQVQTVSHHHSPASWIILASIGILLSVIVFFAGFLAGGTYSEELCLSHHEWWPEFLKRLVCYR